MEFSVEINRSSLTDLAKCNGDMLSKIIGEQDSYLNPRPPIYCQDKSNTTQQLRQIVDLVRNSTPRLALGLIPVFG